MARIPAIYPTGIITLLLGAIVPDSDNVSVNPKNMRLEIDDLGGLGYLPYRWGMEPTRMPDNTSNGAAVGISPGEFRWDQGECLNAQNFNIRVTIRNDRTPG